MAREVLGPIGEEHLQRSAEPAASLRLYEVPSLADILKSLMNTHDSATPAAGSRSLTDTHSQTPPEERQAIAVLPTPGLQQDAWPGAAAGARLPGAGPLSSSVL